MANNYRNLEAIVSLSTPLTQEDSKANKYTFFGYKYKRNNYRKFNLESLINLIHLYPEYENSKFFYYINKYKETVLIINYILEKPVALFFKPFYKKDNYVIHNNYLFPYNIGFLNRTRVFKDPIILCEGIADCEYLRSIYPDTISMLGSNLSTFNFNLLKRLTKKIILCNDNDETGYSSINKLRKKVIYNNMFFDVLKVPKDMKDAGEMLDLLKTNNRTCFDINNNYYKIQLNSLV